ncbi:hypothetical protein PsYK624_148140 [Phanerochaete sordida]|uniref:Uncharacterized protein n=1 Tax=Phanerochaete sordida TaxID=48140 RepID=A0A9P3GPN6_9APHY|nr:hypothetical protein PsYK624_148140 [Phanerochaete sordida]
MLKSKFLVGWILCQVPAYGTPSAYREPKPLITDIYSALIDASSPVGIQRAKDCITSGAPRIFLYHRILAPYASITDIALSPLVNAMLDLEAYLMSTRFQADREAYVRLFQELAGCTVLSNTSAGAVTSAYLGDIKAQAAALLGEAFNVALGISRNSAGRARARPKAAWRAALAMRGRLMARVVRSTGSTNLKWAGEISR